MIGQLQRFSRPEVLKSVHPRNLIDLLSPYRLVLAREGIPIPDASCTSGLDCDGLAKLLFASTHELPAELVHSLALIDEMSTIEGMDKLLSAAKSRGLQLPSEPKQTPADVAIGTWLADPSLLEFLHAQQQFERVRSFECFQAAGTSPLKLQPPTDEQLCTLQKELDDWFHARNRGRGASVSMSRRGDEHWFLVRHGEPFKREGRMDDEVTPYVAYRPERYDLVVYHAGCGELRVNGSSPVEKQFYRAQFGKHLFGDENYFPGTSKYTLEPLRDGASALSCHDVAGISWVKLREIWLWRGGQYNQVEIQKADDLTAAWSEQGTLIPGTVRIVRATFQFKFQSVPRPRSVTIRPSNIAQYARDEDSKCVEVWLRNRGYLHQGENGHDQRQSLLACA